MSTYRLDASQSFMVLKGARMVACGMTLNANGQQQEDLFVLLGTASTLPTLAQTLNML